MNIQTLRRTSQVAFLAFTLIGIAGITTTGIIYPYFFCYSCPWDAGNCPLGIMEHGFVDIQITFWIGLSMLLYLFGFILLIGLLLGRTFCGWACPMGLLQDLTRKFKVSDALRQKFRLKVNPKYRKVKYLILLAIPVTAYLSKDLFYTNLCPVGGVTGTIPTLLFYSSEWVLGSSFPVKLTSIILFAILIILVARGWCKYLCPIGALLAPWNKISPVRITRDEKTCTNCNLCEMKCPMDVEDIGIKPDSECVLCGRCVGNCRFHSLKLGIAPFSSKKIVAVWAVLLLASSAMLAGGAYFDGYGRADKINSLPCLGCLALDPYRASEWRVTSEAQPDFVAEALATRPVFLHYRTDVCPGCDEMEPHIAILEEQYGDRVEFVHINLDHATEGEDASYDIYDFAGTPESRFGVPMFTTVITVMNGTQPERIYNTQYGSSSDQGESKRLELESTILEGLDRHVTSTVPVTPADPSDAVVFTELFVDMGCVNCYKSEDSLMELEDDERTNFVTFITDSPGMAGNYSNYREDRYVDELANSVLGHPWVIFAGGPGNLTGALTTASALASYRAEIGTARLAPLNLSLVGDMSASGETLFANITVSNLETMDEPIRIEAMVVERSSRWLNLQGDPIPNAFVDLLVNTTYSIPAGGINEIPISWTGNDALRFSDMRMGNTAIIVVAWQNDIQITSMIITSSEMDTLFLTQEADVKTTLPNGSANFTFLLTSSLTAPIEVNLSSEVPINWSAKLSSPSILVPAYGDARFNITVTGNGTASADPLADFKVLARGVLDPTVRASSRFQVQIKDDILPPMILPPVSVPDLPRADEPINITVIVGDNTQVYSVKLSYFSCTDEVCSPYFIVDMNLTAGNTYAASVYPVAHDHNSFHYRIIAEDAYGNTQITEFHDIELEPVIHHSASADTNKPKWIGVVLLLVFAAIAIVVALKSRQGSEEMENKPAEAKPGEVPKEPVQAPVTQNQVKAVGVKAHTDGKSHIAEQVKQPTEPQKPREAQAPIKPQIDRAAARARIQKAFEEGRITEQQYKVNMEKFRD